MALARTIDELTGVRPLRLLPLHKSSFGPTYRAEFADRPPLFIKTFEEPSERFFAEADGLRAIARTGAIRTPEIAGVSDRLLALEYIETASPARGDERREQALLGSQLASMHLASVRLASAHHKSRFGYPRDNFIGALPQPNRAHDAFIDFYREERLLPMRVRASDALGADGRALLDRLIDTLDERLLMDEPPSLIHGDLWSGNIMMAAAKGAEPSGPVLVDPAVAYADRELDLAMLDLFGGVSAVFDEAYDAVFPRRAGSEARRPIYQLYYLLVHVALFGGSYIDSTKRSLRAILSP